MKVKTYKITDLDRRRALEFVEASKEFSKASKAIEGFGQRFRVCAPTLNSIHMFQGIETLAAALEIDTLEIEHDEWSKEPRQKGFTYGGIEFFQLCSPEEKYRGTFKKFNTIKLKIKEEIK